MSDLLPKGQRQVRTEVISLLSVIIIVYGYLIISSPADASTVVLAALGIIGGNRAVGSWNSSVQHTIASNAVSKAASLDAVTK